MKEKVKDLLTAIEKADQAALKAYESYPEDGGTCNLDSVVIKLDRWRQNDIDSLNDKVSHKLSGLYKGYRFLNTKHFGQANLRSRMVEAAKSSLSEDGYDVYVYYAMD